MLEELHIRNYALIDALSVRFPGGFCVLTGETGAGKSILIGALGLILGSKAEPDIIRTGRDEAEVSGVIRVSGNADAEKWLRDRDISVEDGAVVIRRVVKRSGRGGVYIGSAPVSLGDLQGFSSLLVDLHGQHEHQSLFSQDSHRRFLDRYGGLSERVAGFADAFSNLSEMKKNWDALTAAERDRERDFELLSFAVDEIGKAALRPDEEEDLGKERKILQEHEKLSALMADVMDRLAENRGGAVGFLRRGLSSLKSAAAIDERLAEPAKRLENLFFELEDVVETVKAGEVSNFDPDRLEAVEERLAAIHKLKKKYGATAADVLAYRDEAKRKLEGIENYDQEKTRLKGEIEKAESALFAEAVSVSDARRAAAARLQGEIEKALGALGMRKIRFQVLVERKESPQGRPVCGPSGIDSVSFLISPNPGEPLKPLRSIASGGELSRVMLAIKTILAESDDIRCLVFDEIDSGIGGEVAVAVGEFLRRLSRSKQVLVITHLASIAAQASAHLLVEKNVDQGRTYTDIKTIEGPERIKEVARMLSGEPEGAASLSHAENLLQKYAVWEK